MNLYYFSLTGTSKDIAYELSKILNLQPKEIKTKNFSYKYWLFLSFIPKLGIKIAYEKPSSPDGILVFPKWTFNCPPVTTFLKRESFNKLFLIITFGGWGEKSYGDAYKRLALRRSSDVEVYYIKKSLWEKNKKEELNALKNSIVRFIGSNFYFHKKEK